MTTTIFVIAALSVTVASVGRTVAIALTVHGIHGRYRAEALRGLAECFRFWRK
ncbi:hypothetical protein NRB20_10380 [Nocardia sp. RB20]|uniref:Uncharacterized protein n=1 Tax=Nocardia macrotermitis TaxID=2585198 RepID=A0A7K0CWT6_9NOCA|nr:hypothetical protein [Nocardia macrotermitis]